MQLQINYATEKQFLPVSGDQHLANINEGADDLDDNTCFLHKETFIKRKIPLNAVISVGIERIHSLKESIENIEHFAKIQQSALSESNNQQQKSSKLTTVTGTSKRNQITQSKDQLDRRRILTQIFRQGLNLTVIASIFDDDSELQKKFPQGKHTCKLLFNTLNPIFNEQFEIGVQMDTKIFDYLKNKKAKFEIRHYITQDKNSQLSEEQLRLLSKEQRDQYLESNRSQITDDDRDIFEQNDFITVGFVTVPLLHLITKNNGIDGDFVIFDDYKQQMGALKLRISLNHHTQQRPLYSQDASNLLQTQIPSNNLRTTMIDRATIRQNQTLARGTNINYMNMFDNQYLLGINFVELIFKNRETLFNQSSIASALNQQSYMYLKFRIKGQNYQTKFLSNAMGKESEFLKSLKIRTFDIKKTIFIEVDMMRQQEIEEIFSKPLEIQLWYKKEALSKYQKPEQEELLGSFFIELNELSKTRNRRIKDQSNDGEPSFLQCHEGYFTLYDYQREEVSSDRLGCKLFLIKKETETQLADAEVLFHNLQTIETALFTKLDPECKGYVDHDDLVSQVSFTLQDPYLSLMKAMISTLDYKNSDKVYYSPLPVAVLPPFFRYLKRFDTFGVVQKFEKELTSLDTHSSGFIPVGMFRSVLEHELKIKEKIVMDFITQMREGINDANNELDVNKITHSLNRNHLDYVVLLRKIGYYFELKEREREGLNTGESYRADADDKQGDEVSLKINIESAMRLKNPFNELEPPSTNVVLKSPFRGSTPDQIQTQILQKSSYPAWHLVNQQLKFSLTQWNLKSLMDSPLEFEVYHHQLVSNKDHYKQHLLGVAYVDLSQMVFVDGIYQTSGYFHVLNKARFSDGHSLPLIEPQRLTAESLGQIKLSISTSTNLKQAAYSNPLQKSMVKENSPIKHRPNDQQLMMTMSFARDTLHNSVTASNPYNVFATNNQQWNKQPEVLSSTQQKLIYQMNQINQNLVNHEDDDQLKLKHTLNMSALDDLISSLKRGKLDQQQDQRREEDRKEPIEDMRMTRGHNESQYLYNQFSKLTQNMRSAADPLTQKYGGLQQNVVEEQEQENSELDRENEMNASQSLNIEQDHQQQPAQYNQRRDTNQQIIQDEEDQVPIKQYQMDNEDDDIIQQINNNKQQQMPLLQLSNVFEKMNLAQSQGIQEEIKEDQQKQMQNDSLRIEQPRTEQKKKSIFDIDDDEEYDQKEMERIAKILGSKKK